MMAKNDERLFKVVRRHTDDKHHELDYTADQIWEMIKEKARDAQEI
jgi:hypothetical protein